MAKALVKTLTVVKHPNIVKASSLHGFIGSQSIAVDGFILKAAEPTFCRSLIPAITFMTYLPRHAVALEFGLMAGAAILTARFECTINLAPDPLVNQAIVSASPIRLLVIFGLIKKPTIAR